MATIGRLVERSMQLFGRSLHSIERVIQPRETGSGKTSAGTQAALRAPRRRTVDPDRRSALLDAAESLLVEEGYAAVTTRRIGDRAGANPALVHYYFGSMDGLFVELFRRGADRGLERQAAALQSPQPLWALWDALHDHIDNVRTVEFFALAHHRPVIRTEVAEYSERYRRTQLEVLSPVLAGYGVDLETWPALSVVLMMGSISLLLRIEEGFGFELGHADMIGVVEREIRALEGDRWTEHPAIAHRTA
jgi:AcrR family transcriptional regulator